MVIINNKYTTTTEQIKELHKLGVDSYNIVEQICVNWEMSVMRASVMVDYVLKNELYGPVFDSLLCSYLILL